MTGDLYADVRKWRKREWVVATARSEWARFYFDTGQLGVEARWWLSPERPKYHRIAVMGTETLLPGPWPFGLKVPGAPRMEFITVTPLAELGGLLLTAWAVLNILRDIRGEDGH